MGAASARVVSVVAPMTYWGMGLYDLGIALVEQTLREAACAYHPYRQETGAEVAQALVFLQGTGLEVTLQLFGLQDYQADRLRTHFFGRWTSPNSAL